MNKRTVRRLKHANRRMVRGEWITPKPVLRRAKRAYVAAKAGRPFGTNQREARR